MPQRCLRSGSLLLLALLMTLPAHAAMTVAMGDEVVLTGTNPGGQTLYLFLTGPNLPPEGVRLADGKAVVTGSSSSFTRAEVLADGTWRYAWDTRGVSGRIDPGSYVIFIVTEPAGRQDLAGKEYTSLGIMLRKPAITVQTASPTPTGTGEGAATAPSPSPGTAGSRASAILPGGIPVPVPVEIPWLACLWTVLFFACFRRDG